MLGSTPELHQPKKRKPKAIGQRKKPLAKENQPAAEARWRLLHSPEAPLRPRASHTAVLQLEPDTDCPSILVYGGLDDAGLPLGDTYEAQIVEGEDDGVIDVIWTCVDEGGAEAELAPWEQQKRPRPRACHSAVFWERASQPCMVAYGGLSIGLDGEPRALGDTWTLLRFGKQHASQDCWMRPLTKGGAPARRWGHGSCLVGGECGRASMLICGGIESSGQALSDCWVLNLEDMSWEAVEGLPSCPSPLQPSIHTLDSKATRPEIGRCSVAWSATSRNAIVWGKEGFLTMQVSDSSHLSKSGQELAVTSPRKFGKQEQLRGTKGPDWTQSQLDKQRPVMRVEEQQRLLASGLLAPADDWLKTPSHNKSGAVEPIAYEQGQKLASTLRSASKDRRGMPERLKDLPEVLPPTRRAAHTPAEFDTWAQRAHGLAVDPENLWSISRAPSETKLRGARHQHCEPHAMHQGSSSQTPHNMWADPSLRPLVTPTKRHKRSNRAGAKASAS